MFLIFLFLFIPVVLNAQENDSTRHRLTSDVNVNIEMSGTFGSGDHAPLWLQANRYGLPSTETNSGHLRAGLFRSTQADSLHNWRYGYGLDLAVAANHTSAFIIHQAYADIDYKKARLTIGAKERPMEFKNNRLSSGSQTFGINARPIPQIRLELPEYWNIPLTGKWLAFKGQMAWGWFTDTNWQHDFTHKQSRYTDHQQYHAKAFYFRLGNERKFPLSFELGLEMATILGGTTHTPTTTYHNWNGWKSIYNAFKVSGGDLGSKSNMEGDVLGSWLARLNYNAKGWSTAVYLDKFFEDKAGFKGTQFNGYGEGDQWRTKVSDKHFRYDFKDFLLGWELNIKRGTWLRGITAEYLYTKYQNGPVHHPNDRVNSDKLSGIYNFYNHTIFSGWQHWGQAIGNPLYYSPLYNDDGIIEFKNNRFIAYHFGVEGQPTRTLSYRVLATFLQGWGTYAKPFTDEKRQRNFLIESTYTPFTPKLRGYSATLGIGIDSGSIIGNNCGFNLTFRRLLYSTNHSNPKK